MLVLSRQTGQSIVVPDTDLTVTVLKVSGGKVRLGIVAPASVSVHRQESLQQTKHEVLVSAVAPVA